MRSDFKPILVVEQVVCTVIVSLIGEVKYWQVTETMRGDDVRRREFAPLKAIADHCPKTILSLDVDLVGYENGIRTMNALDFLLDR